MVGNMKSNVLKAVVLFSVSFLNPALAHEVSGSVAPGGSDVYNFQCFTDTGTLSEGSDTSLPANRVLIRLASASGTGVSAQLGHIAMAAPTTQNWKRQVTDSTTGATGVLLVPPAGKTAGVWTDKGYILAVKNTSSLARTYTVEFHCRNNLIHSGTGAIFTNSQTPTADFTSVINN